MKIHLPKAIFLMLFAAAVFAGCSAGPANKSENSNAANTQNANLNNSNNIKDDLEELKEVIKIPLEPEEIVWREENADPQNPGNRKLTAVFRFAVGDADKIAAQAAAGTNGTPAVIEAESWFPAELVAQSQVSGDETIKGTSYPADIFFQPPYKTGKFTRIENSDYFILELKTQ